MEKDNPAKASPPRSAESEVNLSPLRRSWQEQQLDAEGRELVETDARYFLHQSVSTPCLAALRRADGIWIEDTAGRRYMDFHGKKPYCGLDFSSCSR